MIKIAGVKFKTAGKIYDFKSGAFVLKEGDRVIVETEQGLGFAKIAIPPYEAETVDKKLKQIVRVATKDDFKKRDEIKKLEKKAFEFCIKCINDLGLLMNLFSVESTFDRGVAQMEALSCSGLYSSAFQPLSDCSLRARHFLFCEGRMVSLPVRFTPEVLLSSEYEAC